ncbi:hypothetical protein HS125_13060 [bacterium]|nr:hypothetical protein [bacterium]
MTAATEDFRLTPRLKLRYHLDLHVLRKRVLNGGTTLENGEMTAFPLRPMDVGDILDNSFRIYRARSNNAFFWDFFPA